MKAYELLIDPLIRIYGYAHLNAGESTQKVDEQLVHELKFYQQKEIENIPADAVCQRCKEPISRRDCPDLLFHPGDRVRVKSSDIAGTVRNDGEDFADSGEVWVNFDRGVENGPWRYEEDGQWIEALEIERIED